MKERELKEALDKMTDKILSYKPEKKLKKRNDAETVGTGKSVSSKGKAK